VKRLFCQWRFEVAYPDFCLTANHISFSLHPTHTHTSFHSFPFSSPYQTVIKKGIKKEEAEELKAKLEAVGATIEIA